MTFRLILFFSLLTFMARAQNPKVPVKVVSKPIGTNLLTNQDILSTEYTLNQAIIQFHVDTAADCFHIALQNMAKNQNSLKFGGLVMVYDTKLDKVKWAKPVAMANENVRFIGRMVFCTELDKMQKLDTETGEILWSTHTLPLYINTAYNISIGYNIQPFYKSRVEGIDLASGEPVWSKVMEHTYGWTDLEHIDDSVVLLASTDLFGINLKNGEWWTYPIIKGLVGIRSTCSNILVDDHKIYFASSEKISCLDGKGNMIWTTPLDRKQTSVSKVFIYRNKLYMVNKGIAYTEDGTKKNIGIPFVAIFDPATGKQEYFNSFKNSGPILDFDMKNGTLYLISDEYLISCNGISDCEQKRFSLKQSNLKSFITHEDFIKTGDKYIPLVLADTGKLYVRTTKGLVLELDNTLNITKEFPYNDLYTWYTSKASNDFLFKDNETIILDPQHREIARLKLPKTSFLVGTTLYSMAINSVTRTELKDIID